MDLSAYGSTWDKEILSDGTEQWLWGTKKCGIGMKYIDYFWNARVCYDGTIVLVQNPDVGECEKEALRQLVKLMLMDLP